MLDIYDLCTPELQEKMVPFRSKFKELEDKVPGPVPKVSTFIHCPFFYTYSSNVFSVFIFIKYEYFEISSVQSCMQAVLRSSNVVLSICIQVLLCLFILYVYRYFYD